LKELPSDQKSYFHACWLYAENYMYRKISSIFKATTTLKNYDYFGGQKEHAMQISDEMMIAVAKGTRAMQRNEETLTKLLKVR